MKLHYFKKLAGAMALALTVAALPAAPAVEAEAAATPAFKTTRTSLYENSSAKGVYTYTVKNVKKGYKVNWSLGGNGAEFAELKYISRKAAGATSSNKVTIKTTGDIKAKNSSLSVIAKVYNPSGKLVKTLKDDVKLKICATSVSLKTSKIKDPLDALSVGKSYDFDKTFFPYNATSVSHWKVTDSAGVDHSSEITSAGIWTPTKEGTYTITVSARSSKNGRDLCQFSTTAVVGTALSSVTQTAVNEFNAVFKSDVSKKITVDSFTIKESNGLATVLPKSVSFSKDGKTVTVTTHTNFKNNTSYTVTCGNAAKSFVASAGEVTRIAILTETAPANIPTPIKYALYDANGIDVSTMAKGTVDFSASLTNGYLTENNELFLTTVGKGGTVTATYTEGTGKFTATKTIICKEAEASAAASNDFTITDSNMMPDFTASDYKANTSIAIGDTGYAHFRALDDNKNVINYTNITYASSDDNTLIVEANGKMTPIKEGKVVVIVSAFEGSAETTYTFTVTVQAAKRLSSLGLSTTTVTMSNCGDYDYKKYVDIIPFDQFGNKMDASKCTVTLSDTYSYSFASYNADTGKVVLSVPYGTPATTYTITVTAVYNGVTATQKLYLTVVNVPNSTAIGYVAELSTGSNTIDISIKDGDKIEDKTVYARLGRMQGGIFAGYNYFDSAVITKGSKYYSSDLTLPGSSTKITNSAENMSLPLILAKVTTDADGHKVVQKAETGTYSIILSFNGRQYTLGITVTDKANAPSVTVRSTTSNAICNNALELAKNCLIIPDGYEILSCTAVGTTATGIDIPVTSKGKLHIQTVTLRKQITLTDTDGTTATAYTTYTVNVGQTLTNK